MRIRPGVELANLTDVGLERTNNEDAFGYWEPESDQEFLRKGRLAIVADGMGGHDRGEEASRLAVEVVCETYRESQTSPQESLLAGFHTAHERIRERASEQAKGESMGTTCTALSLVGAQMWYAHVGDSRLYLLRDGELTCLTSDHSRVMELVRVGIVRPRDAETHPDRNVLLRAMGIGQQLQPDAPSQPLELRDGDRVLLCTDGLWGVVGDEQLRAVLQEFSPADACNELVRRSKERGAPDNVTVQILKLEMARAGSANSLEVIGS